MALLTAQQVGTAGLTVVLGAAAVGGDTFRPTSDRAKLVVRNGSGASINVTLTTPGTVSGLAIADQVIAVPAAGLKIIPLLKNLYADPADGLIDIAYSAVTTVDVAVFTD